MIVRLCSGLISYCSYYSGYARWKWPRKAKRQRERLNATTRARYCYSVWLRHLKKIHNNNITVKYETIAELGPGTSHGIGIAAILSGFKRYFALDIYDRTDREMNKRILSGLLTLVRNRADIPDVDEFPSISPLINSNKFPKSILKDDIINSILHKVETITKCLVYSIENINIDNADADTNVNRLQSFIPWTEESIIEPSSVDLLLSQAVLEHVSDIHFVYRSCYKWLKPKGIMSHDIDFRSHGTSDKWNGHWAYSDLVWPIVRKKRPYLITNRLPLSSHLMAIKSAGFEIVEIIPMHNKNGIQRHHLSKRFRHISDEDMVTESAYILAVKR